MPEDKGAASPTQFMPEANRMASPDQLKPEADGVVLQVILK